MSVNHISIDGRLAFDPETRYTSGGMCICSFAIIHNRRVKDKSGEWKDGVPTRINCKAFGKQAEIVSATCKKGAHIQVTGYLETEEWEKDGEKKQKQVVNVLMACAVLKADRPSDGLDFTSTQEKPAAANSGAFGGTDVSDDVPF